jgi:hypothetical protein
MSIFSLIVVRLAPAGVAKYLRLEPALQTTRGVAPSRSPRDVCMQSLLQNLQQKVATKASTSATTQSEA